MDTKQVLEVMDSCSAVLFDVGYEALSEKMLVARAAVAQLVEDNNAMKVLLRQSRSIIAGMPRSLGYDITHLPKFDALLHDKGEERG